jgi:hypothetical protein
LGARDQSKELFDPLGFPFRETVCLRVKGRRHVLIDV